MNPESIGLIGLLLMFVLLYAAMPIGFCMALVGFLGEVFLFGLKGALAQLGMVPYASVASFTLCVIPLFCLMGELAWASGLTEGSYNFTYKILGRIRGGLAMSTIAACAIFAACTGSALASAATMVKVALPGMREHKYDLGFATGTIAAGGTLGILIPPSNPMVVYAILTGASIGKLFIGGILPGILLSGLFMLVIYIMTTMKPSLGPAGEKANLREILTGVKEVWPAMFLILAVLGGLWGGVFSPSEAGAVGAFVSLLIIIGRKGFAIKTVTDALTLTAKTTAMIFTILIGAMIFGDFLTASNLPAIMVKFVKHLSFSPTVIVIIIMVIYIILGGLMDELAIMMITIPVIFPIITSLGIDPVWFGILFVIQTELGLLTPPIAMVVFVLAGMLPDIPMYTIFKGIVPFGFAMILCLFLVIFFPEIAMWLPNHMIGR